MSTPGLCSLAELDAEVLRALLGRAAEFRAGEESSALEGKTIALVFEKPSTRTRVSFEVAIAQLGGRAVVLGPRDSQIGRGESAADTARTLERYCEGIVCRTGAHQRLLSMQEVVDIPVVNALSDLHHPCQVLADLLTIQDEFGSLEAKAAWIGDGNNVCNSWIEAAKLLNMSLTVAAPHGYEPAISMAADSGIALVRHARDAVAGASVVMTDVWTSMGQEEEQARRRAAFEPYRVDRELLSGASENAVVLHCLPAHRGEEVSGEVLDGPRARIWEQVENRLWVQKALLEWLFLESRSRYDRKH